MSSHHSIPKGHEKYGKKCTFLHSLTLLKIQSIPDLHTLPESEIYNIYCTTYENFKTVVKEKESSCEHVHEVEK